MIYCLLTCRHNITEILLKVALNIITLTPFCVVATVNIIHIHTKKANKCGQAEVTDTYGTIFETTWMTYWNDKNDSIKYYKRKNPKFYYVAIKNCISVCLLLVRVMVFNAKMTCLTVMEYLCHKLSWICTTCRKPGPFLIHDLSPNLQLD